MEEAAMRMIDRLMLAAMLAAGLLLLGGCGKVPTLRVTPQKDVLFTGDSVTVAADFTPAMPKPDGVQYSWSSKVGRFEPQHGNTPSVTYQAPADITQDPTTDTITCIATRENGDTISSNSVNISIHRAQSVVTPPIDTRRHDGNGSKLGVKIRITSRMPYIPKGSPNESDMVPIQGTVTGMVPEGAYIGLYTYTTGYYIQPTEDEPQTPLNSDKTFQARVHPGAVYYAFVINGDAAKSLRKSVLQPNTLPQVDGKYVLASTSRKGN
jgi:hypothetical protein